MLQTLVKTTCELPADICAVDNMVLAFDCTANRMVNDEVGASVGCSSAWRLYLLV